jgi:phosphoglycolate phosphatase
MGKEQMKYEHVVWDWNGTLFDDVHLCVEIINGLLKARNLPVLSVEKYKNIFTFPVRDYYYKLGFDFEEESFEKIGAEWMKEYERRKYEATLFEDAKEIVEKLKERGIKQSVLSAYSLHTLREALERFGLLSYFVTVKGLDNIYAASKMELGIQLAEELNLSNGRTLLIGDTLHDADVAHELGFDVALVSRGHQSDSTLRKAENKVYASLREMWVSLFENR